MQAVTSSCAGLSIAFDHGRAVSMVCYFSLLNVPIVNAPNEVGERVLAGERFHRSPVGLAC